MNAPSLSLFLAGGNTQAAEWLRWHAIENYSRTGIPTPNDVARMRHDEAFMWRMLVSSCYGANGESMLRMLVESYLLRMGQRALTQSRI